MVNTRNDVAVEVDGMPECITMSPNIENSGGSSNDDHDNTGGIGIGLTNNYDVDLVMVVVLVDQLYPM